MKRHFNALSWSEWTWQRPFSEEDVKEFGGYKFNGTVYHQVGTYTV